MSCRAKSSAAPIILCIWVRSSRNLPRCSSLSIASARNRSRVIGVPRSCAIAAASWMRSSMRQRSCSCMRLKACTATRTSDGPRSRSGGALTSPAKRSAAWARTVSGSLQRVRTHVATKIVTRSPTSSDAPNLHVENGLTDNTGVSNRSQEPLCSIISASIVPFETISFRALCGTWLRSSRGISA